MARRARESSATTTAPEAARDAADTLRDSRRHYLWALAAGALAGVALVAPPRASIGVVSAGLITTVGAIAYASEKRVDSLTRPHRNTYSETSEGPDLAIDGASKGMAAVAAGTVALTELGFYGAAFGYNEAMQGQLGPGALFFCAGGATLGLGLGFAKEVATINRFTEEGLREHTTLGLPSDLSVMHNATES